MTGREGATARGFTLVEVLVALAIAGVALAAGYRSVAQSTESATAIRLRTLAGWVAQNRLAEAQLASEQSSVGERSGQLQQGGSTFWWREQVSGTPNPQFRRVALAATSRASSPAASIAVADTPPRRARSWPRGPWSPRRGAAISPRMRTSGRGM